MKTSEVIGILLIASACVWCPYYTLPIVLIGIGAFRAIRGVGSREVDLNFRKSSFLTTKMGEMIVLTVAVFACVFFPSIAIPLVLLGLAFNWNKV
jgi:uncharacterized membrane protein